MPTPTPLDLADYQRYLSATGSKLRHAQAYVSYLARGVPSVSPTEYPHLVYLIGDYLLDTPSATSSLVQLKLWLQDAHSDAAVMVRLRMLATVAHHLLTETFKHRFEELGRALQTAAKRQRPAAPIDVDSDLLRMSLVDTPKSWRLLDITAVSLHDLERDCLRGSDAPIAPELTTELHPRV